MKNLLLILALIVGTVFIGEVQANTLTKAEIAKLKQENRIKKLAKDGIPFREEFRWYSIKRLINDINAVAKLKKKGEYINILLDSGGGQVFSGINLLHTIERHQANGLKFRGVVETFCASMCFITLQALDERVSYRYALIMDHRPSGGSEHVLQEIVDIFKPMIYRRLTVDLDLYLSSVWNEVWLGSKKSIKFGLLDRVVTKGQPFAAPVVKVKKVK